MSAFECPVVPVKIVPHPNADAIEIAQVGDFQSIVKKGQFKDGDLAVYLPEASLLPEWLLKQIGMWDEANGVGKLNGPAKNRIKAIKLRGVLSQGVVVSGIQAEGAPKVYFEKPDETSDSAAGDWKIGRYFEEGEDAAAFFGITKYEPTVPAQMMGKCIGANMAITHNYDFENIKKHPDLFEVGEDVVITEKIHGTLLQICAVPDDMADEKFYGGRVVITSKGLGGRGIILDHNDETNVYARACKKFGLLDKMLALATMNPTKKQVKPIIMFGEVYGGGVQDLDYASDLSFRAFDAAVGVRDEISFVPFDAFVMFCNDFEIPRVPVLYRGPYSKEVLLEHTNGTETVSGKGSHIREGVVVKTAGMDLQNNEPRHKRFGRKIAKSISDAYLLRKNGTEFN